MATGETTTGSLSGALPSIISQSRIIREDEGTYKRTTDFVQQKKGTGLTWQEFSLNQITGTDITETTRNDNFQQLSGQLLTLEPDMVQILIKITDRTMRKIAAVVEAKMGSLAQNAMERKKDEDYLALFSGFATTVSPGTGNPLSFGHIAAGVANIESNATEPGQGTISTILHGFQIYDIQNEVLAGVGTYTIPNGLTEEVFRKGFRGTVAGSNLFKDGNIAITGTDSNGAVHALEAVVSVSGMARKPETDRDPYFGGGADVVIMTDEYGFIERTSAGTQVWAQRLQSDTTAPSS